jgi:hypothetical protein
MLWSRVRLRIRVISGVTLNQYVIVGTAVNMWSRDRPRIRVISGVDKNQYVTAGTAMSIWSFWRPIWAGTGLSLRV